MIVTVYFAALYGSFRTFDDKFIEWSNGFWLKLRHIVHIECSVHAAVGIW